MTQPAKPRKTPCASCPYRKGVLSGIWHPEEYEKLPRYDGDIAEQSATAIFSCHLQDGCVCSGWLGHRDPMDLLAVRLGLSRGDLDEDSRDYTTRVPLFESGAAAAHHGLRDVVDPGTAAQAAIDKLIRQAKHRGD
ncbi:DUF6283 family protein [Leifsonia sp. NPDC058194]|uniref:DUF6283 family protein n=1 Tax=Leifsonia sp. NPDC058194 TaxID=3346374 RepID=UPI0036DABFD4